ncbi:MAG TPA: TlpA disulfide reductase family protein [Bryobacteraceae bacterium]|nr:TlpA disulfide reductase family protein [Bryobacteraceae bacterium]
MHLKTPLLLTVAAAFVVIAPAAERRRPMGDFQATTLTGETLTRDSLKGKPYLLQFWTTWCGYCRRDQPAVEEFIRDKGENIPVVCVNVKESRRTVTSYLADAPRSCKVVLTEDTNLTAIVKQTGYPKYILVDAEGNIASVQNGAGGIEGLRAMLAEAGVQ